MKFLLHRLVLAIFLGSLLLTNNLFAQEELSRSSDYEQINKLLIHITTKSSSPFVDVDQSIVINNDKDSNGELLTFNDIRIWISHKDEIIHEVSIDAEGIIDLPVVDEEIAQDVKLNINQDSDVVSVNLSIGVNPPLTKEVSYKTLFILLKDTNDFISEMAGGLSWFAPSMDELLFKFEEPATITINSKKKKYSYKTNDEMEISISLKSRLMKEDPLVIFSHLPIAMSSED